MTAQAAKAAEGETDSGEAVVIDLRADAPAIDLAVTTTDLDGRAAPTGDVDEDTITLEKVEGEDLASLRARAKAPPAADAVPAITLSPDSLAPSTAVEPELVPDFIASPVKARRVYRILRRVDAWSVLKISLIFFFCLWLVLFTAGVILWNSAVQSGSVDNIENLIATLLGFETFAFQGDVIFRVSLFGGLTGVVLATAMSVLMAVLFNLISDLTGGIRVTVIQEESARRRVR